MSDAESDSAEGIGIAHMEYAIATEVVDMQFDEDSGGTVGSGSNSDADVRIADLTAVVIKLRTQCNDTRRDRIAAEVAESELRDQLSDEQGRARDRQALLRESKSELSGLNSQIAELTERLAAEAQGCLPSTCHERLRCRLFLVLRLLSAP